ncbi:MAG: hypothetical protein WD894_10020 [Pirellulales bacterium]
MSIDWQDATALMAVAVAGGYLARRAWLTLWRKRAGCGACGSCPSSSEAQPTIVVINLPAKPQARG